MQIQMTANVGGKKRTKFSIGGMPDELVLIGLLAHLIMSETGDPMDVALVSAYNYLIPQPLPNTTSVERKCKDLYDQFYKQSFKINITF